MDTISLLVLSMINPSRSLKFKLFFNNFHYSYNTVTEILKKSHSINGHAVQVNLARPKTEQQLQQQHRRRPNSGNNEHNLNTAIQDRNTSLYHQRDDEKDEQSDSNDNSSSYDGITQQNKRGRGNNRGRYHHNRGRPPMRGSSNFHGKLSCATDNIRCLEKQTTREHNLYTARIEKNLDPETMLSHSLRFK
jgi:hypothetical protein